MSAFPIVARFTVPGLPVAQGSKRVVPTAGGPRSIESNEKRLRPWRSHVATLAADAMTGPPSTEALQLRVGFCFPRPKSHYGTGRNADALKPNAPEYVTKAPDLDKLARAIGDALSGIVYRDDAQIAHLNVWKVYGESACAHVEIRALAVSRLTEGVAA